MDDEVRTLELLRKLNNTEEFQLWRDAVCKPMLESLEQDLKNSDTFPEAVLRGKLKHYFSEKYRFHQLFGDAVAHLEVAQSVESSEESPEQPE